jgi:hypothetical protein
MKLLYGGPGAAFSSLQTHETEYPILNLEKGCPETNWGQITLEKRGSSPSKGRFGPRWDGKTIYSKEI